MCWRFMYRRRAAVVVISIVGGEDTLSASGSNWKSAEAALLSSLASLVLLLWVQGRMW